MISSRYTIFTEIQLHCLLPTKLGQTQVCSYGRPPGIRGVLISHGENVHIGNGVGAVSARRKDRAERALEYQSGRFGKYLLPIFKQVLYGGTLVVANHVGTRSARCTDGKSSAVPLSQAFPQAEIQSKFFWSIHAASAESRPSMF